MALSLRQLKIQGQGPLRLWLVSAVTALVCFGTASIWQHNQVDSLDSLARTLLNLQEARRTRMVNQYAMETKEKFAALPKIGGRAIEPDEERVRERGHQLVTQDAEYINTSREIQETFDEKSAAVSLRTLFAILATTLPVILYFALLLLQWIRYGFDRDLREKQRGEA